MKKWLTTPLISPIELLLIFILGTILEPIVNTIMMDIGIFLR